VQLGIGFEPQAAFGLSKGFAGIKFTLSELEVVMK
jgi:hypothetical protein